MMLRSRCVLCTVVALAITGLSCNSATAAKPLNVLFITMDDMNCDSVGVYGSKVAGTTPHLDRLARQGLRFEHGHVTIAICQPTRAVWMTGRYPHNSGALGFNHINPGVPTLPETLRKNGYITGILGKTQHVVPSRKGAFDYHRSRSELANGRSAKLYAKYTGEFLDKAVASGKPFFFMVNTHDPHRPFHNAQPRKRRKTADGKARPNKLRSKYPAPSKVFTPKEIVVPGFLPDLPPIRKEIAQYYSSVRRADDVVGAVLKVLDEKSLADNTLVMCKSDHGIPVPFAKTNVWRHSTHTPWIVRWPGVVKANSHDTQHLVAGVDFAPTILDAFGIKPMKGMDGRSFLPILKSEKQAGRDYVFTHINTTAGKRSFPMRSVQTKTHGYIWNGWSDGKTQFKNESMSGLTWLAMQEAAKTDPKIAARVKFYAQRVPEELYDYEKDPDALDNLIDKPATQATKKVLRAKLLEHMRTTNDPQLARFKKTIGG